MEWMSVGVSLRWPRSQLTGLRLAFRTWSFNTQNPWPLHCILSSPVCRMLFPLCMSLTECHAFSHLIDLSFLMKLMKLTCPPISFAIRHPATHPRQVAAQMLLTLLKCLLCARCVLWQEYTKAGRGELGSCLANGVTDARKQSPRLLLDFKLAPFH